MAPKQAKWTGLLALGMTLGLMSGCAWWDRTTHAGTGSTTARASAAAEPRGPVETTADATITAKVKTKFAADELVKAHNINVDTVRGIVTLNGTVNNASERDRALALARDTQGVVEVKSNLKLAG